MSLKYEPASEPLHTVREQPTFSKSVTPRCTSFEDTCLCSQSFGLHDLYSTQSKYTPLPAHAARRNASLGRETGIVLPNNQRQHRTLHILKDVRCPTHCASRGRFLAPQRRTCLYRGTLLIRHTPLLGPYRRTIPRALWWSWGGGQFLVSEASPLFLRGAAHHRLETRED